MIANRIVTTPSDDRSRGLIERLTDADALAMLALATLTKPGPFGLRTPCLGEFWGVGADAASEMIHEELTEKEKEQLDTLDEFDFGDI